MTVHHLNPLTVISWFRMFFDIRSIPQKKHLHCTSCAVILRGKMYGNSLPLILWHSDNQLTKFRRLLKHIYCNYLRYYCAPCINVFYLFTVVNFFSFSSVTLLGERKGIWPVKSWVMVCWWRFDWRCAHLIAPVVITTSIILSSNNSRMETLVMANPGPPEKWLLKWRENVVNFLFIALFYMNTVLGCRLSVL